MLVFLGPVPGLGHLYFGNKKKGLSLLVVFFGLIAGFISTDLLLMKTLLIMVYFTVSIPAFFELYQIAAERNNKFDTNAVWYTVMLLLFTGFAALPLLWQNDKFSKKSKVIWTVTVPVLAVCFFAIIILYRNELESLLENILVK